MSALADAAGAAPFVFVVGKGGVGKTTAAAALALEFADAGTDVHLISTDPAHSLSDVLAEPAGAAPVPSRCNRHLTVEEFDAPARATRWLDHATGSVAGILEAGTYLDAEDVAGFTRLALPGVDEMMAVLRLVDLAEGRRVVVDTAPTGHTLRLLDAGDTYATVASALRAMADKAAVVASSMAGRELRLLEERFIDELEAYATSFRDRVLDAAAFVVVTRADAMVVAETVRLLELLDRRHLRVAAVVRTGPESNARNGAAAPARNSVRPDAPCALEVPILAEPTGCDGLRSWRDALRPAATAGARPTVAAASSPSASAVDGPATGGLAASGGGAGAVPWFLSQPATLLVFAGKGGVGKTTCAAAAAMALAGDRPVLLCSTDPAGSLDDVFAGAEGGVRNVPRLRMLQVDARRKLDGLKEEFREDVLDALDTMGLSSSAALDRRVVESLWDLAPPGIDEFAALAALVDAAGTGETIVLDTAPTGHFLRLLAMPDLALDWTRQLMRVIVKYHAAGAAAGMAESLLRTARELKAFQELVHDPARTAVVAVTLDEPVVQAETARLHAALRDAGVPVAALLVNRTAVPGAGDTDPRLPDVPVIRAPLQATPPVGAAALREFAGTWKIEA
ncbi:MAG TPA: ArsA-related P-loop ATPase [Longimicrobiales bacterium]|nr:ArsA-related P-loop ATPase [Longimicrobiales bacterium]